jgi:hypothetical protein
MIMTMGMDVVGLFGRIYRCCRHCDDYIEIAVNQFRREGGQLLFPRLGPTPFDCNVPALGVAELL